ncbi:hypothetical protein C9994_01725 [Marivirga lumbricoides]|uniref:TonB-dependent receptor plug domain-containing protein n=1 Tax=Marivirga lumbricoides TaxID=1046115 RepID=A0A2T4DV83_9BACT|nr:hypothetical protein C9994_01725 [Marivirga lumbricoides]
MWFKLYSTAGYLNQLSPLSKIVYVEFYNPYNELIDNVKIFSDNGIGSGYFQLSNELETGSYLIKAYTKWMLNDRKDFIFKKEVKVFNLFGVSQDSLEVSDEGHRISLSFMPEGGKLIDGVETNVAFKAIGEDGYGIDVSGKVFDENENVIGEFTSNHLGMGVFSIKPVRGANYYARLVDSNERYELPNVEEAGIAITLLNIPQLNDVRYKIDIKNLSSERIHILSHCRGLPTYVASSDINSKPIIGLIAKDNFLPGINYITIFNDKGLPLAERAFFINDIPSINLSIKSDKELYGLREKVQLKLYTDSTALDVPMYLSLSATSNNDVLLDFEEDNIVTYLYLSSDINGHIEKPANYFNGAYEDAWKRLDLLMMTQAWSNYNWDYILSGNSSPDYIHKIEQGLSIKGKLTSDLSDKASVNGYVNYFVQDSNNNVFDRVEVNEQGEFEILDLFFTDKKAVVLTGFNKRDKPYVRVQLDTNNIQFQTDRVYKYFDHNLTNFQRKSIKNTLERKEIDAAYSFDNNFETLDEVTITADRITKQEKVNNLYGKGDVSFDVTDLEISESAQHPLELIRGRIAGVRVSGSAISWSVEIRGPGSINSSTQPLILVDNVEVPLDFLNSIPASQIEMVEVYKGASAAIFGVSGANGVLSFFTKPGSSDFTYYDKGNVLTAILQGYQSNKEFYSPDYSVKVKGNIKPDKRAQILWEPMIKTKKGLGEVSFYTTDEPMDITVYVEGMTQDGKVGRVLDTIKVRK